MTMPGFDSNNSFRSAALENSILPKRQSQAMLSISNYKRHSTLKATTRTFLRSASNSTCSHTGNTKYLVGRKFFEQMSPTTIGSNDDNDT